MLRVRTRLRRADEQQHPLERILAFIQLLDVPTNERVAIRVSRQSNCLQGRFQALDLALQQHDHVIQRVVEQFVFHCHRRIPEPGCVSSFSLAGT